MSFRRYEITLPTRYNDGQPVEPAKHLMTRREILVDVEDTPENDAFFRSLKQTLKTRFQQLETGLFLTKFGSIEHPSPPLRPRGDAAVELEELAGDVFRGGEESDESRHFVQRVNSAKNVRFGKSRNLIRR